MSSIDEVSSNEGQANVVCDNWLNEFNFKDAGVTIFIQVWQNSYK